MYLFKIIFSLLLNLLQFKPASEGVIQNSFTTVVSDTSFTIVKIAGMIKNIATDKSLKRDDQISSKDSLAFETEEAFLVVIDNYKKETYELIPNEDLISHQTKPSKFRVETRPGKILTYIALTRFLEGRRYLILDGKTEIQIGEKEFPMDNQHFFYIQYDWVGDQDPINKKLAFKNDWLLISKEALFKVNGNPIRPQEASNFKLFYYDLPETESLFINKFDLIFPDEQALKREIQTIIRIVGKDDKELFQKIDTYINSTYGEPEIRELKNWLKKHFGLTFSKD